MNARDSQQLTAIVYVSAATWLMDVPELEAFLLEIRAVNEEHGVTGVLLYSEGSFMQYFEGTGQSIDYVYQRIKASRRHKHLIEMVHEPIERRLFADWHMAFVQRPPSELLRSSSRAWEGMVRSSAGHLVPTSKQLLLDFWANGR